MKMKKILFGFLAINFVSGAFADLTGTVVDAANNKPLAGVLVGVHGVAGQYTTDANGKFSLSGDVDGKNIKFAMSGYTCTIMNASDIKSDTPIVLKPSLKSALQKNYDDVRGNEQSLANRTLGAAAMATVGAGGQMTASSLSEQKSDADAERDMAAYLATFRCDWGSGRNVRGGETNVELPGAGQLIPMYSEYVTLANDLKLRKAQLGLKAGIESEPILDSATTGLYDDVSTGISSGAYASLARALQNPNGADAKMWAEQKEKTAQNLKTGIGLVATGVAASVAGNAIINRDAPRDRSREIIAEFESLFSSLEEEVASLQSSPCSGDGVSPGGFVPECECIDKAAKYFPTEGVCRSCQQGYHYDKQNECVPDTPGADTSGKCHLTGMATKKPCECVRNAGPDENGVCKCKKNFVENGNQCICFLWPSDSSDLVDWDNCRCAEGAGLDIIGAAELEIIGDAGLEFKGKAKYCQKCDEGFHTDPETNRCVEDEIVEVKEEVQEPTPQKIKPAIVPADKLFEVGKADVRDEAADKLENFVQAFNSQKDALGTEYCIHVVGHTDRTGWPNKCSGNPDPNCSVNANQVLSENRARAVADVLEEQGIEASNICAAGNGQSLCKSQKADDENCRRVDVSLDLDKCPGDCLPWNQN